MNPLSGEPSFDADTRERHAEATAGDEAYLEALIERWAHEWMRHANMDY